ncbi:LapA family protein [Cylindrospermum sp. FACHB-282]|uniref:LapA family protein n=1 Tax=Cylindrospermum sp. FACHB-282 TaxID=2692794 RepID=UPI0016889EEE|nr:LapA family protein [Cylindrospermum sp. FACHB-282]MBD2386790.1 LapA family protein [Cylindrospermum sp. FACHB-282]
MKNITSLLISVVIAVWVVAIAIISVQNATPVSLKFLIFQSVQIPMGLVLAFSAAVGLIGMAVLQPLWGLGESQSRVDEDAEFFVDDEDF